MSAKSSSRSFLTVPVLMLLQACTTGHFDECGVLYRYSPEFEHKAELELDYLANTGQYPEIITMMNDYHTTRETIRVCQ